jgi:hypothetical protein
MDENPYRAPKAEPEPACGRFQPLMDRDPERMSLRRAAALTTLLLFAVYAVAWLGTRLYEAVFS